LLVSGRRDSSDGNLLDGPEIFAYIQILNPLGGNPFDFNTHNSLSFEGQQQHHVVTDAL
jgi:hypothetical protein